MKKEEIGLIPGSQDHVLRHFYNEAEKSTQKHLLQHRFLIASGVEKSEAETDPDKRMNKIIQPGQKAHEIDIIKKIISCKHGNRPSDIQYPIRFTEIELDSLVCISHH